jgi:hypothetical protein
MNGQTGQEGTGRFGSYPSRLDLTEVSLARGKLKQDFPCGEGVTPPGS